MKVFKFRNRHCNRRKIGRYTSTWICRPDNGAGYKFDCLAGESDRASNKCWSSRRMYRACTKYLDLHFFAHPFVPPFCYLMFLLRFCNGGVWVLRERLPSCYN